MKLTTDKFQELIEKHWDIYSLAYYFAQVLSGEETIDSTIRDLLSFERK